MVKTCHYCGYRCYWASQVRVNLESRTHQGVAYKYRTK